MKALVYILALFAFVEASSSEFKVTQYPIEISQSCRSGKAKIYDECSDQFVVLTNALKRGMIENKSVLVVYGAEWCIWCHVFEKHVNGQSRLFSYKWIYDGELAEWTMFEMANNEAVSQAKRLNKYVSENFVIAYIEGDYSPNGGEVVSHTGFDSGDIQYIPFIMSLNVDGKYSKHMKPYNLVEGLEIREDSGREYRGFDREILLKELKVLRKASLGNG